MFALAAAAALAAATAQQPLIGIYPTMVPEYYEAYTEYLAQAGGRSVVLPRFFADDPAELDRLFRSINGLLIPGGDRFVGNGSVDAFVARATRANLAEADYFPIWGTCLGFEYMVDIVGGRGAMDPPAPGDPIVPGFDSEGIPLPLNLTRFAKGSRMLRGVGEAVLGWVQRENITYNAHQNGVEPAAFARDERLSAAFRVLGSSVDRKRRPFVALIEGISLPYYGAQFHPEKIEFVCCPSV